MDIKKYSLPIVCVLLAGASSAFADDIDIYYSTDYEVEGAEPMVMFSLDWRPNLGASACGGTECDFLKNEGFLPAEGPYTYFDMLRAVLRKVMDPLDGLRVGLMLNHDYTNNCAGRVEPGCSNGGYIGLGFEPFEEGDANGSKARFHDFLDNVPTPQGNASHMYQGKELFFEFFRYLSGQDVLNGHVGFVDYNNQAEFGGGSGDLVTETVCEWAKITGVYTKVCADVIYDPDTQTFACELLKSGNNYSMSCTVSTEEPDTSDSEDNNLDVDNPSIAWDKSIEADDVYISPLQDGGRCTKIFTVNVMFQVTQQDANSDSYIEAQKSEGGFSAVGENLEFREFEDVVRYMNDADLADGTYGTAEDLEGDQNVTSYFIVDESKINTTTRGYAQAGGTGSPLALSGDPAELIATLEDVFNQILSVSTTFVSASVPVNAFNRAEIIDNIYLALFKTDPDGKPIWTGNVKKLKYAAANDGSGEARIEDATNRPAIAADGRIAYAALTYWTDKNALPAPNTDELEVAGADGRSTTRGGAGQKIPGFIAGDVGATNADGKRQLYFDAFNRLYDLDANDVTKGFLAGYMGVDPDEALELIKFARGMDVNDEDNDDDFEEPRAWIMGDPLHSRPLPINYGAISGYDEDNQAVYIAFGSNDGFMRLIKNTTTGGADSGEEVWAYMPKEVMDKLPTLKDNAAGGGHPYLVDGTPSVYVENGLVDQALDDEDVFLYFGLRRGGKAIYALDISDPEDPDFLWKVTKSGDFAEMGYTFSDPVVGRISDGSGGLKPIVIFGGGYDLNKDSRSGVGTDDSEGNAIFVVDGETGELIWKGIDAELVDSIASAVTAIDTNGDRITDRIYVGDTGGRVWRADIGNTDTSDWELTLLADLGRHYSSSKENDRRFFHPPDVVQARDDIGPYDAVVLGSGDRADPLGLGGAVDNFVYMIKDRNISAGAGVDTGLDHGNFGDVTYTCVTPGAACMASLNNGWRMGLTGAGESSMATPLTIGGTIYFTTYLRPGTSSEESCGADEGSGRLYAVLLDNASAVENFDTTTEIFERFDDLESKGIPSEVIYIPPVKDTCTGDACVDEPDIPPCGILDTSLKCRSVDESNKIVTYWSELENNTL